MTSRDRPIRILVADDSPTALIAICNYLKLLGQFEIIGTAQDGEQLVARAQQITPDLVLTDLSMPRLSGLEAATQLRKLFPGLRILILTQMSGRSLKDECMRCGADGFIEKGQLPGRLMQEVRRLFFKSSLRK